MSIPRKKQLIGLDIGSFSIKLVEINHNKKGRRLKNFGVALLPEGAIVEGEIQRPKEISSVIKRLFHNLKVRNKKVAISISGFSVIAKKIKVDISDEEGIEKTIRDKAEEYIPFDIDDVNLDFDVLEPEHFFEQDNVDEASEETSNVRDVMVVAAKKDIVNSYMEILEDIRLVPVIMDVDMFALQNAFEISKPWDPQNEDKCIALVDIGAEKIGINIIKENISLFTRVSCPFGGMQITGQLMSKLKVGFEEAEKIKTGGRAINENEKDTVEEIVASVVSEWVREIKSNIDFVYSTYPDESIEKIFVSGGAIGIAGFKDYLNMETGIPVYDLNPFANLIIDESRFDINYLNLMAPQSAVAVGLALRSVDDK